jgi:hypothetical protein
MGRKKGKPRMLTRSSNRLRPSWLSYLADPWLAPLMAALMFVGVVALVVGVLVVMDGRLVAVLLAVVDMALLTMGVVVFMLVFAVAAHLFLPPDHSICI